MSRERKRRGVPLEVKRLGKGYYLYRSTTVWDRGERRRRKVSRYVGRITQEGVVEARERWLEARTIHEFGNAKLGWSVIEEIMPALRSSFPDDHEEIAAMALVRAIQQTPIRLVKSRWEKLYLSQELNPSLSPNVISEKLGSIGADYASRADFSSLMRKSRYLIFDFGSIFSYSENLNLMEKGHNAEHLYVRRVNFAMIFSHDERIPVMIKPVPGSVRDIKSFKSVLQEYDVKSCTMVMDRGMASYTLPSLMKERELRFVFPLRRNIKKIVDYGMRLGQSFPTGTGD